MKNFILLNGCVGVGKTSVAEKLYAALDNPAIIHGDDLTKLKAFDVYSPAMKEYGIQLMNMAAVYHFSHNAVDTVIMDYIVENNEELTAMLKGLAAHAHIHCFYLHAPGEIIKARIQGRERPGFERELRRADQILEEQTNNLLVGNHSFHMIDAFNDELEVRVEKILGAMKSVGAA